MSANKAQNKGEQVWKALAQDREKLSKENVEIYFGEFKNFGKWKEFWKFRKILKILENL